MSGPVDQWRAALSDELSRARNELVTVKAQRDQARTWAVALEQQVAEWRRLAMAATPAAMGGTPDLFAPECWHHGSRCEDPWSCHQLDIRTLDFETRSGA